MNKLTEKQEMKLKEHAKHHTAKHIRRMKKLMKEGMSFTKSHNEVKKMEAKEKKDKKK